MAGDAPAPKSQKYSVAPEVPEEVFVNVTDDPSHIVLLLTEKFARNLANPFADINKTRTAKKIVLLKTTDLIMSVLQFNSCSTLNFFFYKFLFHFFK